MDTLDIADIGLLAAFSSSQTVCASDLYSAYKQVGIGRDAARTRINNLIQQGLLNIEVERHAGRFAGRFVEFLAPAFEALARLIPSLQPAPAGTVVVESPLWCDNHHGSPEACQQGLVQSSDSNENSQNELDPSRARIRAEISLSLSGNNINSLSLDLRGENERGNNFSGEKDPEAQRRRLQHQAMLVEMAEKTGKPLDELIAIYGREPHAGKMPPSSAAPPAPQVKKPASGMTSVRDRVKATAAGLFQPRSAEADEIALAAEAERLAAEEKAKAMERETRKQGGSNAPSDALYQLSPGVLVNQLYRQCINLKGDNPTPEKDAPYLPRLANWLAANDTKEVRLKMWHAFKFAAKCGAKTLVFAENNMRNKQLLALSW